MDTGKENIGVLTEHDVKTRSRSYVANAEKEAFVNYAAMRCFDRMELSTEDGQSVPPMWKENAGRKNRYMAAALVRLYLFPRGGDAVDGSILELDDDEWDALASFQLTSQLERMKKRTGDQQLRDKIYDMISDYHVLEKLLNAECYGLLNAMNDPVARFRALMSAEVTPEAIQTMQEQMEETKRELEEYISKRGAAK